MKRSSKYILILFAGCILGYLIRSRPQTQYQLFVQALHNGRTEAIWRINTATGETHRSHVRYSPGRDFKILGWVKVPDYPASAKYEDGVIEIITPDNTDWEAVEFIPDPSPTPTP